MSITRYTTPPITFIVEGVDITGATTVYATIRQGRTKISKTGNELTLTKVSSDTQVIFSLSQIEAGQFKKGQAKVQVNWITGGIRYATEDIIVIINENILDEVIS